ncbi:secretin N-terminal domain-containing protein [Candidatus Omnitrophota bacterium]
MQKTEAKTMIRKFRITVLIALFLFYLFAPNLSAQLPFFDPGVLISMDFKDASVKDILKVISMQSGLNFIASESVQDRKISLYLDKVSIKEAMGKLFKANNLTYELDQDSGIFLVTDWGTMELQTVTRVFYLKHASVASSSLKEEMGYQIRGDPSSSSTGSEFGKWSAAVESGISNVVEKLLSSHGSLIEDYRTNSLIVTDLPSRMPVIAQTIASLDISIPQILLEVEMLDVSKNVVDQLGVDWPSTLANLTISGTRETRFPFGGVSGSGRTIDPEAGVFGTTSGGAEWDFGAWDATRFGPSILTVIGATLAFDFLSTQTDTKYLARPRLMTLNNETAEIRIVTQESVGVTTVSDSNAGTTSAEPERVETGVLLRVTPQVNMETREITMFIYPQVSEATTGNIMTVGGASYQYRDPEVRSTKTMVRIKDGETVVIGGLIRNEVSEVEEKIPILGDLPIIGALFRHKGSTSDKDKERELVVFITPRIIDDGKMELAQAAPASLAEREQGSSSGAGRQAAIEGVLNRYEKRKK